MKHAGKHTPAALWLCFAACLLAVAVAAGGFFLLQQTLDKESGSAPVSAESDLSLPISPTTQTADTTTTIVPTTTTTARKQKLTITTHQPEETTTEPTTLFGGTSDPAAPLLLNGKAVERTADGAFSLRCDLTPGVNRFVFSHKGQDTVYTVRYTFVVMKAYTPHKAQRYKSGAVFNVVVTARRGSRVTAVFQNKKITLKEVVGQKTENITSGEVFTTYTGSFTLPSKNTTDLSLGVVRFSATHSGITDTGSSGNIVCEKAAQRVIGEIVTFSAETFNGNTVDDDSRPTNNYFPQGTVDYVVGRTYYGDKEYLKLRCGRRVYVNKNSNDGAGTLPVSKTYAGELPSVNRLSVAALEETARFTTLTLNTAWKAPFLLELSPQQYKNPSKQEYSISSVTYRYVDITFCYAESLQGNLTFADNHPLFSRGEITKSGEHTRLRLYLKNVGSFYGWDASYNAKGQLVFRFLHPAQVKKANNSYGADLTGVTILLDVGHGGNRSGAVGLDAAHPEQERNLFLAKLLKDELESIGATVVLNRRDNTTLYSDERCEQLKQLKPDLCISVHHDSSTSPKTNGFGALYSTPFSMDAARFIYEATMAKNIYHPRAENNRNRLEWHYYFVARMTDCPVVLTENGFMSSSLDHTGIVSESTNRLKAQAITQGVADYFLSLRSNNPFIPQAPTTQTTSTTTQTTTSTTTQTTTLPTTTDQTTTTEATTTETSSTETSSTETDSTTEATVPSTTSTTPLTE